MPEPGETRRVRANFIFSSQNEKLYRKGRNGSRRGREGDPVSCGLRETFASFGKAFCLTLDLFRGARDPFDGAQPVFERALGRLDQYMLDARFAVGGEPSAKRALILAVPSVAQRDGEPGLGALLAQPADDRSSRFGRKARAVPAVGEADRAGERRLRVAADPYRD